jgi:adenine-specific DNA-methyltransferase
MYLRMSGQKAEDGDLLTSHPETSGRYHSAWISMMDPRLFLARQLLRDDGVIFVSIDDVEVADLRLLMNEVFSEENFVSQITWKKAYGGGSKVKHVVGLHEYVLCYARDLSRVDAIELPPDPTARRYYKGQDSKIDSRGPFRTQPLATTSMDARPNLRFPICYEGHEIWPDKQWQWSRERVSAALANDELVISRDRGKWSVSYKQYLRDIDGKERGAKPFSVLDGPYTQAGTAEIAELFGSGKLFTFPKPTALIGHLLRYHHDDEEALVLDFFFGSSSTAHAVLSMNAEHAGRRRFIMVQLPEPTPDPSDARAAGFGNIADIGKERTRRVISRIEQERAEALPLDGQRDDLGFRVFKLTESHFDQWAGVGEDAAETYPAQMSLFADALRPGVDIESVVFEISLKEGYGLNCQVDRREDIAANAVHVVTDPDREQSFAICLDEALSSETLVALDLSKDDLFICRDKALDDTAAANLALQCRLKTI